MHNIQDSDITNRNVSSCMEICSCVRWKLFPVFALLLHILATAVFCVLHVTAFDGPGTGCEWQALDTKAKQTQSA